MWLIVTILNSIDLEDWLDSDSVSLTRKLTKWCGFHTASFKKANDAKLVIGSDVESMTHPF